MNKKHYLILIIILFLYGCGGGQSSQHTSSSSNNSTSSFSSTPITLEIPRDLRIATGDTNISLSWVPVTGAIYYNLYYATEAGVHPSTYTNMQNGTRLEHINSPNVLRNLVNGTKIFVVVTAIFNEGESAPSNEMSVIPQELNISVNKGTEKLNDTGIDWCADAYFNNLECPIDNFKNQDADNGRDFQAATGLLVKNGAGLAGFDFTKLDSSGNSLPTDASTWDCVRDNVTELIWEIKTKDGGLRDMYHYYTWYDPNIITNAGDSGLRNDGNCVGSDCDTYSYVQAINSQQLCGFNDWRMPSRKELQSIVNYGRAFPSIDANYFPDITPSQDFALFWSSSNHSGTASLGISAWMVDFHGGIVKSDIKYNYGRVRLVRADQ